MKQVRSAATAAKMKFIVPVDILCYDKEGRPCHRPTAEIYGPFETDEEVKEAIERLSPPSTGMKFLILDGELVSTEPSAVPHYHI